MNNLRTKALVFVGVAAVHIVFLYGFGQLHQERQVVEDQFVSELILLPPLKKAVTRSLHTPIAKEDSLATTASRQASVVIEQSSTSITTPPIDWSELGASVAEDRTRRRFEALKKEEAMTGRTTNGISDLKVPSLFGPPRHRHGDSEPRSGSALITWMDERCFATNQHHPSIPLDHTSPKFVCKDRHKADTDLFNHLKPSYLDSLPKPLEPRQ